MKTYAIRVSIALLLMHNAAALDTNFKEHEIIVPDVPDDKRPSDHYPVMAIACFQGITGCQ